MSRVCCICGKAKMSGNTVSHSNRKAPRTYNANIQKVSMFDSKTGATVNKYLCTRCLRTLKKKG